jgi:hypothetical protein
LCHPVKESSVRIYIKRSPFIDKATEQKIKIFFGHFEAISVKVSVLLSFFLFGAYLLSNSKQGAIAKYFSFAKPSMLLILVKREREM